MTNAGQVVQSIAPYTRKTLNGFVRALGDAIHSSAVAHNAELSSQNNDDNMNMTNVTDDFVSSSSSTTTTTSLLSSSSMGMQLNDIDSSGSSNAFGNNMISAVEYKLFGILFKSDGSQSCHTIGDLQAKLFWKLSHEWSGVTDSSGIMFI
jgi:hypothetical protein